MSDYYGTSDYVYNCDTASLNLPKYTNFGDNVTSIIIIAPFNNHPRDLMECRYQVANFFNKTCKTP